MHTITFYSYKGGVGRTLAVANVARYLARMGKTVFVLDFDLEAPGLHYKFELEHGKELTVERGLVDILSEFATLGRLPNNLTDYVMEVASPALSSGRIHLLPAGNAPSLEYWRKLSKVDWHTLFYADQAEGIPLFLELKAFIEETYAPDFVLIDARTGITEMGGVATTVLSDRVVCLMLPTREHLEGTRGVMHAIRSSPRQDGGAELGLIAVLSRFPQKNDPEEGAEVGRVMNFLNAPIDELGTSLRIEDLLVLHRDSMLEEREQILVGSARDFNESQLLRDYIKLFVKLVPPREIENSIGRLIEDIKTRVFQAPDEAEQAMEDLAKYCMHPQAYRELLAMYQVRRSGFGKVLEAAYVLWKITGDARELCLWEAIKGYQFQHDVALNPDRIDAMEAIWRARGAEDPRLGIELSRSYSTAKLRPRGIRVLEELASKELPSADTLARLISLLCQDGQQDRAAETIELFKGRMATAHQFLEAWAEKVMADGSYDGLQELLADPCFKMEILAQKRPVLVARLRFYYKGDRAAAMNFYQYQRARIPKSQLQTNEIVQLGALARELNDFAAFEAWLGKTSLASRSILESIKLTPALPMSTDDGIPF